MATLKFKPDELLKKMRIRKYAVDQLISEGKGGSPGTPTPDWDKNWPKPGTKPRPEDRPKTAMNFEDTGLGDGGFISTDKPHIYINSGAEAYILEPNGNFKFDGFYDPARHGNAFPGLGLVRAKNGMKIAKKKRNEQRAYEDFVRDSQNMPLDESFKDLRRGQDGEGFDILRDLLDLDEAKNNARNGLKIAQNFSPADVPLGDGLIYEAKTKMQQNLKQKYDMMLENGMMSEEEYHKQMQRTMGTKKK